jgi:hypothetical protein
VSLPVPVSGGIGTDAERELLAWLGKKLMSRDLGFEDGRRMDGMRTERSSRKGSTAAVARAVAGYPVSRMDGRADWGIGAFGMGWMFIRWPSPPPHPPTTPLFTVSSVCSLSMSYLPFLHLCHHIHVPKYLLHTFIAVMTDGDGWHWRRCCVWPNCHRWHTRALFKGIFMLSCI